MWQIITSGRLPPAQIMAKDQALLTRYESGLVSPQLHLYEWEGECLTHGYFTHPGNHLNLEAVEALNLQVARRPTGGGILFHLTDLAFSVLIPAGHPGYSTNTLDNYAYINGKVARVIAAFTASRSLPELFQTTQCTACSSFCMANPTQYDLIVEGRKVGGAAQRRTKWGYLHQGSLSLAPPPAELLRQVLKDQTVVAAMQTNSYYLLKEGSLEEARQQLKELLIQEFVHG